MRSCFRKVLPAAIGLAALALVGLSAPAQAQVTTGAIRGRIVSTDGQALSDVEIIALNVATGVSNRTASDQMGRYRFPALQLGTYTLQARRIGFRPMERRNVPVRLGRTIVAGFNMVATPVAVEELAVTAEDTPLIDPDETGTVDLVSAEQIAAIPVNGRNFADLVALSPMVGVAVGDGTGGNLSLGGGRRGANLIQIDGAGTTGTFFGGEARGSDRIPFAFSIESVREFQIVTNGFDVGYGFFSGGVINAVTKSGTNEFHGSLFGYLRHDKITRSDFLGRDPDFSSKQSGATFSGPLVRDKAHFFLAIERQDRNEPVFGLPLPGSTPDPSTRVHPDSVQRFLDILSSVYGVEDQAGQFSQNQDEWNVFGRLDIVLSDKHRLTLRHNYTDLEQLGDRINPDETIGNGGVFNNTGNSSVVSLNSVFSPNMWNEARVQLAFEPRPREANSLLPESEVFVDSDFGGGVTASLNGLECCNDAVLPNNLEETTFEFTNNLNVRAGDHEIKLGAQFNYFDYVNFFFFRQQGRFRFGSLAEFEARQPFRFERALPNPGPDGQFFTTDDVLPLAEYKTYEISVYAQDTYRVSDQLSITGGVRADFTRLPDEAPLNNQLITDLGLRTDVTPDDNNISPRVSFTYDPTGRGTSVIHGGVGLFFGRFPSVLYSNSLLNTGANQLSLRCDGAEVPTPDYQQYAADLTSIPTGCAGGGAASPPIPDINLFADDFEYPRTWKASAGFEQALTDNLKVSFDYLFSSTSNNFYVVDRNLLPEQFKSGIENRPVFADGISSSGFAFSNKRSSNFDNVLEHVSTSEARTHQFTVGLEQRGRAFSWQLGYTYTSSKDNASYSCCISSTAIFETPSAGNSNFLGDRGDELNGTWGPSDFSRPHTIVLSGIANLPYDFSISGIWRVFSGRPWTPVVDGDANGDRGFSNDRAFIPDPDNTPDAFFDNPAADKATLRNHLQNFECLRENLGRITTRNSCRNDVFTNLDIRLRKRFRTYRNHGFEIILDFFNVLNFINSDWSKNIGVPQFGDERELLELEGYDSATNQYSYSVNPSFGTEVDLTRFRTDQGSLQIGIKYDF